VAHDAGDIVAEHDGDRDFTESQIARFCSRGPGAAQGICRAHIADDANALFHTGRKDQPKPLVQ
jgi:hypothetical protein